MNTAARNALDAIMPLADAADPIAQALDAAAAKMEAQDALNAAAAVLPASNGIGHTTRDTVQGTLNALNAGRWMDARAGADDLGRHGWALGTAARDAVYAATAPQALEFSTAWMDVLGTDADWAAKYDG